MSIYLDVGVTRIQQYLDRTTGAAEHVLRKRRGASSAVAEATDVQSLVRLLGKQGFRAEKNDETYDTEGVSHLRLDGQDDAAEPAVDAILRSMRSMLPGAYLEASWAPGATYAEALPALREQRESGLSRVWLPVTRDDVITPRCASCGIGYSDTARGDCDDCQIRDDRGRRGKSRAERWLTERMGLALASDFGQLAALARGTGKKANHLATVYADGNGVGALFEHFGNQPGVARELSSVLDRATREATLQAVREVWNASQKPSILPIAPAVAAADDIIVTMPAAWAWKFTLVLHRAFAELVGRFLDEAEAQELCPEHLAGLGLPMPSLSGGLVFAHQKHPIELVMQRARTCLREAKGEVAGREAVICWTDLTQESGGSAISRRSLTWFETHFEALNSLAGLPANQRNGFARSSGILRDESPAMLLGFIEAEALRLGSDAQISPFIADGQVAGLIDALSIADWW